MKHPSIESLEEKLEYRFRNIRLLEQACTHSSFANQVLGNPARSNERLEFLGDAVLELVSSHFLYENMNVPEGQLSRTRAALVCEASLAAVGERYGLGDYLRLATSPDQRLQPALLEDLVESIIGAVYLDGGLEQAERLIHRWVLSEWTSSLDLSNYKSALQELVQGKCPDEMPEYRLVKEEGPQHKPVFTMECIVYGETLGVGTGSNKKEAEQNAAKMALSRLQGEACS